MKYTKKYFEMNLNACCLFVVRVPGISSNLNFYEIHNLNQRNLISTSDIPNCQSRRNKLTPNLVGWFCLNLSR